MANLLQRITYLESECEKCKTKITVLEDNYKSIKTIMPLVIKSVNDKKNLEILNKVTDPNIETTKPVVTNLVGNDWQIVDNTATVSTCSTSTSIQVTNNLLNAKVTQILGTESGSLYECSIECILGTSNKMGYVIKSGTTILFDSGDITPATWTVINGRFKAPSSSITIYLENRGTITNTTCCFDKRTLIKIPISLVNYNDSSSSGYTGDGDTACKALLNNPKDIVGDSNYYYIADTNNHVIRKIEKSTNTISTIAGTGIAGFSGDDGQAILAQLNSPSELFLEGTDLLIVDSGNNTIRKIDLVTNIITSITGKCPVIEVEGGPVDYTGNFSVSVVNISSNVVFDSCGNMYIAYALSEYYSEAPYNSCGICVFDGYNFYKYCGFKNYSCNYIDGSVISQIGMFIVHKMYIFSNKLFLFGYNQSSNYNVSIVLAYINLKTECIYYIIKPNNTTDYTGTNNILSNTVNFKNNISNNSRFLAAIYKDEYAYIGLKTCIVEIDLNTLNTTLYAGSYETAGYVNNNTHRLDTFFGENLYDSCFLGLTVDSNKNLYISYNASAEFRFGRLIKITYITGIVNIYMTGSSYVAALDDINFTNSNFFYKDTTSTSGGFYEGGTIMYVSVPFDISIDNQDNIYLTYERVVRKINNSTGLITLYAGKYNFFTSFSTYDQSVAIFFNSQYNNVAAINTFLALDNNYYNRYYPIVFDVLDNLYYIAGINHGVIRRIDANTNIVSSIIGNCEYDISFNGSNNNATYLCANTVPVSTNTTTTPSILSKVTIVNQQNSIVSSNYATTILVELVSSDTPIQSLDTFSLYYTASFSTSPLKIQKIAYNSELKWYFTNTDNSLKITALEFSTINLTKSIQNYTFKVTKNNTNSYEFIMTLAGVVGTIYSNQSGSSSGATIKKSWKEITGSDYV